MKINAKRIIFHAYSGLGDTTLYIPSLFMIKQMYPDAELVCTVNSLAYDLFQNLSYVDKVVCVFYDSSTYDQAAELLIKEINGYDDEKGHHPCADVVILAERATLFINAALKSNCPHIVTFSYFKALFVPRLHFTPYIQRQKIQEILHYQHLVKQLNPKLYNKALQSADFNQARLKPTVESLEFVKNELSKLGYQGQKLVLVNPLSITSAKKGFSFDIPSLISLANELAKEYPQLFFVVSLNKTDIIKPEDLKHDNLKLLVNQGSIYNLIALVDLCSLVISPSTGTVHIADNMGKDILGIYPYYDQNRWDGTAMNQLSAKQDQPSTKPNYFSCIILDPNWKEDVPKYFDKCLQMCRTGLDRLLSL